MRLRGCREITNYNVHAAAAPSTVPGAYSCDQLMGKFLILCPIFFTNTVLEARFRLLVAAFFDQVISRSRRIHLLNLFLSTRIRVCVVRCVKDRAGIFPLVLDC